MRERLRRFVCVGPLNHATRRSYASSNRNACCGCERHCKPSSPRQSEGRKSISHRIAHPTRCPDCNIRSGNDHRIDRFGGVTHYKEAGLQRPPVGGGPRTACTAALLGAGLCTPPARRRRTTARRSCLARQPSSESPAPSRVLSATARCGKRRRKVMYGKTRNEVADKLNTHTMLVASHDDGDETVSLKVIRHKGTRAAPTTLRLIICATEARH
jgi:hypothetical protein